MSGKAIVPAVALILVVGVVIGVVAVVQHKGSSNDGPTSTHMKAVTSICQNSDDQKLCKDTLSPVKTDDPKDYIKTVVQSSMDSVIKAFNLSDRLNVEHGKKDVGIKMALDDCKDLLQSAIHELEASGVMIQDNNLQGITNKTAELKNWLGAVIAYQQSCVDGFNTDGEKKVMEQLNIGGLDNVEKLTGLALDVVSGISEFLSSLDLNLNLKPASRRLLDADEEGFAKWYSNKDRKLLANRPLTPEEEGFAKWYSNKDRKLLANRPLTPEEEGFAKWYSNKDRKLLANRPLTPEEEGFAKWYSNKDRKLLANRPLTPEEEGFAKWYSNKDRKLLANRPLTPEEEGFAKWYSNKDRKLLANRLLDVDEEGFAKWYSNKDRKLLADGGLNGRQLAEAIPPNAVVAKDGSGQFNTIQAALNAYPKKNLVGKYVIYVKAGVYDEYITIDKSMPNILMYGDGPTKTIVTGNKNFRDGVKTMKTASFSTMADDFTAKSMAFENTAGPGGHQAVALRVQGDRSAFFDVAIRGYQDSLYAHAKRQFYRNCEISGTVDFIFGYATTLIQNSKIIVRKPDPNQQNIVVADGTVQKNMPTGIVLQNCEIVAEPALEADKLKVKSYLARPWKQLARTIIMESQIGDFIVPEGYMEWAGTNNHQTCYFAEYKNAGPGSNVQSRVKWGGNKGLLSGADAARYTAGQWLEANTWLPATGVPFAAGFTK